MEIGLILSNVRPIVENIFKFIEFKDLDYYSSVCKLWKQVAETEKLRRKPLFWFFQGLTCSIHGEVYCSYGSCKRTGTHRIENELSVQFKDMYKNPLFCLIFATNDLIEEFETLFPSFLHHLSQSINTRDEDVSKEIVYLKTAMKTAVTQYLPENCRTAFVVTSGIIGSYPDCWPLSIEDGFAISGLMIPSIPGLEVYKIPINGNVSELIPKNCSIKCLLVFFRYSDKADELVQQYLERENFKLAVGGIQLEKTIPLESSVIAFCGDRLKAVSIVIDKPCRTSDIEEKLMCFYVTGLLNDKCFAFLFTCCSVTGSNSLTKTFHSLYPSVPLIGSVGRHVLGLECMPNFLKDAENQDPWKKIFSSHAYRYYAVFVLVSLKLRSEK